MSTIPEKMTNQATTLLDLAHRQHGSLLIQEFFVVALALQKQDLLGMRRTGVSLISFYFFIL
jgi:hypothetical protein